MTAPLPPAYGPAGNADREARERLADRLDEWDTAHLRLALQAVIPALTPGQVFGLAAVLGLCDRWAGDIAGRAPAVAPDGNGRGEPPELDGSARTTPQGPDRGPFRHWRLERCEICGGPSSIFPFAGHDLCVSCSLTGCGGCWKARMALTSAPWWHPRRWAGSKRYQCPACGHAGGWL